MSNEPAPCRGIRPRADSRMGARQSLSSHRAFPKVAHPGWTSYASQSHVLDIDVDLERGWMWMATWGGVLCWKPKENSCVRYTSAHGLIGNATRSLAVDQQGNVWAGGMTAGLCHLPPGECLPWEPQEELRSWTVLRLAPRPGAGVYAALRDAQGKCALGEIGGPPDYRLDTWPGGLATKEIETLLVDQDQTLWLGNLWGLHRQKSDRSFATLETPPFPVPVHALADIGPMLWVGTDQGVYSLRSDQEKAHREPDWPYGAVVSLTVEPATGSKWVVTEQGLARIVDNTWQALAHFPAASMRLNELLVAKREVGGPVCPADDLLREHQTWAGGAGDPEQCTGGLYRIGVDGYESVFDLDAEDTLGNSVQCLWVDDANVWVGTTRGLSSFDGHTWRNCAVDDPSLRDVRAILPAQTPEWLWVGSGQSGLQRLHSGVHVPDVPRPGPIVAMAAGSDGTLWAATPEQVLCRAPTAADWVPAKRSTLVPAIQTLCALGNALWVGTADGLWCYRPDLPSWPPPADEDALRHRSIQALAVDPIGDRMWVGTDAGLYSSSGGSWVRYHKADVRAMAFAPEGTLWLGTDTGLERWPSPGDGSVFKGPALKPFTAANSGLAAGLVTALAVRAVGNERQVWIGSPAGVSCYRYTS